MGTLSFSEHLRKSAIQFLFNRQNLLHNDRGGSGGFILIEISSEGNLVPNLGFLFINPGIRCKGQNFTFKVRLNIFFQGYILCIPKSNIRLGLVLFQNQLAVFISQRTLYNNLGVTKVSHGFVT